MSRSDVIRYAAYGSNLHPLRLEARIQNSKLVGKSFLSDWSLHFNKRGVDGSGKCNILPGACGVHFAIYEVSADDKRVLDTIEGVGKGYENSEVDVPEFGVCFTYVASHSHTQDDLAPYDWYKELVLLGCRRLDFPVSYLRHIEGVYANGDPSTERGDEMWGLVNTMRAHL